MATAASRLVAQWIHSTAVEAPLLLCGSDPEDSLTRATQIARALVCAQPSNEGEPCEQCSMCHLSARGSHPDILQLDTSTPKGRSTKEVRRFVSTVTRTAWHGRRVALVPNLDELSLPALTTLLKPLEEPGRQTRYIVTVRSIRTLPATIVSRCQQILLAPTTKLASATAGTVDPWNQLSVRLGERLRTQGPSPALRRAMVRLRDYYQIRHLRGNTKLARHIVVACLYQLDHTLGADYDTE